MRSSDDADGLLGAIGDNLRSLADHLFSTYGVDYDVIDVRLALDGNNEVLLEVRDDEVGITEQESALSGSMGMQLVADLTTQREGSLEQDNTSGTVFRIRFPRPSKDQ